MHFLSKYKIELILIWKTNYFSTYLEVSLEFLETGFVEAIRIKYILSLNET